ncbi:DUF3168 domain-containing protein [Pulveribacter sp.]|uniref:tail completion protein gp17 n=1 Tax=Pulveribacter sp. TaxID=2678893 RepID=UPI0028AF2EF5|nr:DUF3168 domain-containing protein [Pulveribacter sp.]
MSIEANLQTLLLTLCPRVRADVAEDGLAAPYVVWQAIGGEPINALDNSLPGQRRLYMQVSVWAKSRMDATGLAQAIEASMRAAPVFVATPSGEAMSTHEPDTKLYGAIQRFSIWGDR